MSKNIKITLAAIVALVIIFAVILVGGNHKSLGASMTTFLPSLGLQTLTVGSGCDNQYTSCTGTVVSSTGINSPGLVYAGQGLVEGGVVSLSTTTTSYTLTQADILTSSLFTYTTASGNATITLPASTTLTSFVTNSGDQSIEVVYNGSATSTLTIAGGTGTTVQNASSTLVLPAGKSAQIRFVRLPSTSLNALFVPFL